MLGMSLERFVALNLRILAASFFAVGVLFIATPDGVLSVLDDVGDVFGTFTAAPDTDVRLWLALGFSYMMVITGICLVAQADVVRYRPLLLVLAAGKAASSLSALGFYVFTDDVFAYLANFIVDGFLVGLVLWLWALAGRVPRPAAPA